MWIVVIYLHNIKVRIILDFCSFVSLSVWKCKKRTNNIWFVLLTLGFDVRIYIPKEKLRYLHQRQRCHYCHHTNGDKEKPILSNSHVDNVSFIWVITERLCYHSKQSNKVVPETTWKKYRRNSINSKSKNN